MLDPVVVADAVEQHGPWSETEPRREDLAVVTQQLLGCTVSAQGRQQRVAHGPRGRSSHDLGADAEPRVIVDAGHDLALGAIGQEVATHDVHLPELHGPGALPALVVRALSPALRGLDEPVPDQGPIDRRARRQRLGPCVTQPPEDRPRSPAGVRSAHLHDLGLDRRRHLVRAALGLRALVGERAQALVRIAPQPGVDGLASHPVASCDVSDARAVQDLYDGLVSLLHQIQLHQHGWPPLVLSTGRQQRRRWRPPPRGPSQARSVKQVPEPLSPRCRSRAGECQARGGATVSSMNRTFTDPLPTIR